MMKPLARSTSLSFPSRHGMSALVLLATVFCLPSSAFCLPSTICRLPIYHLPIYLSTHQPSTPSLPSDVKADHWSAPYVLEVMNNGVMSLMDGKAFHGEAKVTHGQAVLLLAHLAQELEAGTWQMSASRPVSVSVLKPLEHADWRTQKVTRYEMAKVLASMGDYVANGLPRPAHDAKDLNKSTVLPPKPTINIARSHPAFAALTYLVNANMVTPNSPLLKADDKPVLGGELSRALADMVVGLTNRLTELGLDENGETPDATSIKKAADKKRGGKSPDAKEPQKQSK